MFSLFQKCRSGEKGQLAAALTLILVAFVIIAFISVNVGKEAIKGTRALNASQAAAVAAGSTAAVILNNIANLNDMMIMNFSGFALMMMLGCISWIVDLVKLITKAIEAIFDDKQWGVELILAIVNLWITTTMLALQIAGATKVGNATIKIIEEDYNQKLPKNTRNSARTFAFMNAGIDEPKIPFADAGTDAWGYSLIETGFDAFMRVLPNVNFAESGNSPLTYSWQDKRRRVNEPGVIVTSEVTVAVEPLDPLALETATWGDIASDSGLRGQLTDYVNSQVSGVLGFFIELALTLTPILLILMYVFFAIMAIIVIIMLVLLIIYAVCCVFCIGTCKCCTEIVRLGVLTAVTFVALLVWGGLILDLITDNPPDEVPAFLMRSNEDELGIGVTISRSSSPGGINYGIFTSEYAPVEESASAIVDGGSIFPPNPDNLAYDALLVN